MKRIIPIAFLLLAGTALTAQAPPSSPAASHSYSTELGFSYDIPSDWKVTGTQADSLQAKQQAAENASSEEAKKGMACAQIGLTAHHGASVIVDVALPFDCFGRQMSDEDMHGFGEVASQGVKQSFDIGEPTYATYSLGTHNLWIERVAGALKGQPGSPFTIEVTCAVLKRAAVCWIAMAEDGAALKTFEHAEVTLDGEAPVALVPATAFDKKPL